MSTAPVIVIGSGAAGLSAALMLVGHRPVTVVTKGTLGDGATAWAQGGLAAVTAPDDSAAAHVSDTVRAGAGLCNERAVAELVTDAPAAIERLVRLGARFDRTSDGAFDLGLEGGHRARRIVHAGGDASGAEVARTLARAVRRAEVTVLEHTWAVDAIRDARGEVTGVRVMDADGRQRELAAGALVLATGGIGRIWSATTNPATATGDGLALAARAGAVLRDVEFMQFHPTMLATQAIGDGRGILVTEALRGEGAVLVDADGRRVMTGLHPLADLAPRDVVAAAMHESMRRTGVDHLYLDGTAIGASAWEHHFPTVLAMCRARGVDPVVEPIPVRPGAHYHCGGVAADLAGRTSVGGLFAVGEVACTGVQGANRLASNSLTEALVAGQRCGALLRNEPRRPAVGPTLESAAAYVAATDRNRVVEAMSAYAGVSRTADGLRALDAALRAIVHQPVIAGPADLEATNLHLVATLVASAAATRQESRGCHRRSDYPVADPAWNRHIDLTLTETAGQVTVALDGAAAA